MSKTDSDSSLQRATQLWWMGAVLLVVLVVLLAVWRGTLIGYGPDPDSDSYGHHVIARNLAISPLDHGKHWVWLPLFHWFQLPVVLAGGNMEWVRVFNVVLWAAVPLLLYAFLRQRGTTEECVIAFAAATVLAVAPLGMQMGTTAQPEPLFVALLLLFAWAMRARWQLTACALLCALVLLRYEAWAVLAVTGGWQAWRAWRRRSLLPCPGRLGWTGLAVIAAPGLTVLLWAALRAPFDGGTYFAFLGGTHEFASEALRVPSSFEQGLLPTLKDSGHYVTGVAWRVFGPACVFALFGVVSTWRQHRWLSLTGLAILGFITLGWLTRSTLGLERHFVAVLPLWSVLIVTGAVSCLRFVVRWTPARLRHNAGVTAVAALVAVAPVACQLKPWMGHWQHAIERTYTHQSRIARYLETLPTDALLFCDEPTIEGLTRFPYQNIERGSLDWSSVRRRMKDELTGGKPVYVASWYPKIRRLPLRSELLFRAGEPAGRVDHHPDKSAGLAVVRLEPKHLAPGR